MTTIVLLVLLALLLSTCSQTTPAIDGNLVPAAYRSNEIVIPPEIQDEYAALPGLWATVEKGIPGGDVGIIAAPMNVRRADVYWNVNRHKMIENNLIDGASPVTYDRAFIQMLTLSGTTAELDTAAQDIAERLHFEVNHSEGLFNDRRVYLFSLGQKRSWGEIAWLCDQLLLAYPDLVLEVGPKAVFLDSPSASD